MRQLEQRIAVRFHIHELTRTETEQYITHRMSVAGAAHTVIWSRRALRLIHHYTGGIPRRINLLCDRMLMTAFVRETHRVSAAIVRQSVQDLASPWQPKRVCWLRRVALGGCAGLGLLGLVGGRRGPLADRANAMVSACGGTGVGTDEARHTRQPRQARPATASPVPLPPPVSEPASPVAPVLATPVLVPPSPPLEIDVGLAQTLWRLKTQAEEQGSRPSLGS